MRYLADIITACRLFGTAILLFRDPIDSVFFIIYTLTGVTDVLDGLVARATHTESDFGQKLDSVADLLFYIVMFSKIWPILQVEVPTALWAIIYTIIAVRGLAYIVAAIRYKKFASMHTYSNKATGMVVFLIPYMLLWNHFIIFACFAILVAAISTSEELAIHLFSHEYNPDTRTFFAAWKRAKEAEENK